MAFDKHLLKWHKDLPPVLRSSATCPPGLLAARGLMNARFQNLRLVIHRPRLLIATLRRTPPEDMLSDETEIVERCRAIASEIIIDVQRDWFPIQQIVRNSVWFFISRLSGILARPVFRSQSTSSKIHGPRMLRRHCLFWMRCRVGASWYNVHGKLCQ